MKATQMLRRRQMNQAKLAEARRLYHHVCNGGTLTPEDVSFVVVALEEAYEEVNTCSIEQCNEFRFFKDQTEVLRLDGKGFHYKGQTVDDAGEAYRLFMDWMKNSIELL